MRVVEWVCELVTGKRGPFALTSAVGIGIGVFIGMWAVSGFDPAEVGPPILGGIAGLVAGAAFDRLRRRQGQEPGS
ncbi:MAG: hypothetical protein U5Q44_01150 [Dehalococcoidia bacterium]|nr:hypothetical protein [Dehalococcoidia bacterium]